MAKTAANGPRIARASETFNITSIIGIMAVLAITSPATFEARYNAPANAMTPVIKKPAATNIP